MRFTDHSSGNTLVKVMTDGILLAEMQRDRELRRYDTVIIDKAHERSLNIDFIRRYLKQLSRRRPDLKVIITSATIDSQRFSKHFDDAPIIEVLATSVAETSLTVPGIGYVGDAGTARISRYSQRTNVQHLPIERISRASASQRAGCCGRVAAGICIRLYSQEGFEARSEFTDPEILRTNLASVILQMTSLGLGDIAGARTTDSRKRLTAYGRKIAALPLDLCLARMVLEAGGNGAFREVLIMTRRQKR